MLLCFLVSICVCTLHLESQFLTVTCLLIHRIDFLLNSSVFQILFYYTKNYFIVIRSTVYVSPKEKKGDFLVYPQQTWLLEGVMYSKHTSSTMIS